MLSQLKTLLGKPIRIELRNGSKIFGTVLDTNEEILRIDTGKGIATILVESIQIIWENQAISLEEMDMEEIVGKVRENETRYMCMSFNGFVCPQSYTCRPPHACTSFFCPGAFTSFTFPQPPPPPPPPPPDIPCQFNFFGYVRPEDSKKDNKPTKE